MLDPTGNFIISTVDTAPDPADEGLTLTVDPADEGLFTSLIAVGAFNAVVWPFGVEPRISSAEIIRVTDITDGVFTIERGQEGTTARNIATGWSIAVTPTTKMMDDIQTDLSSRVPYTGASTNVDLGENTLDAGGIRITDSMYGIYFGSGVDDANIYVDTGALTLYSASSLYTITGAGGNASLDFRSLSTNRSYAFPDKDGTFALVDDIPVDISELTDTTGIIPVDVSDLTDTTGVIPADVSDLTDTTGVIPVDVSDLTDTTSVIPTDVNELDDTSGLISGKIAKTTDITAINDTGIADGEIAVFNKTNKDIRTSDKFLPSGDVVGTTDTQTLSNKTLSSPLFSGGIDGWVSTGETWEYVSVDDPTGIFRVQADVTTKYSAGMRIKMTNGGNVIYGIITVVGAYSGGYTSITFLHEIDPTDSLALYLLANSAITLNYYSTQKAPFGFPLEASKWTIFYGIGSNGSGNYLDGGGEVAQFGTLQTDMPIGSWIASYKVNAHITTSSSSYKDNMMWGEIGISTTTNSFSDGYAYNRLYITYNLAVGTLRPVYAGVVSGEREYIVTSKTTFYLVGRCSAETAAHCRLFANLGGAGYIKFRCAYL